MSSWIANITRIHIGALKDRSTIQQYSIAQRMSWAATRETTRPEDVAYCLLGIFGIYMAMLYGEGDVAFKRLQQEIIQSSDDQSIFAWDLDGDVGELCTGILATSPKAFLSCGSIVRDYSLKRYPFRVTNLGLSVDFPSIPTWHGSIALVGLNCARELRGRNSALEALSSLTTVRRSLQAWIFLYHTQDKIYQRIHLPASTVFLQPFYISNVQTAKSSFFIETQKLFGNHIHPLPTPLVPHVRKYTQASPFSSGLMITFGWGIPNKFNRYEKAFNFGEISSQTLTGRSPLGISHQLVCNPKFCLVFSIAWNQKMQPQNWTYSIFADADRKFWGGIVGVEQWNCLFNDDLRTPTYDLRHVVDLLYQIHDRLRQGFREAFQQAGRSLQAPIVAVSRQELHNLHGQCELLVDISFREKPQDVYR